MSHHFSSLIEVALNVIGVYCMSGICWVSLFSNQNLAQGLLPLSPSYAYEPFPFVSVFPLSKVQVCKSGIKQIRPLRSLD